MKLKDRMSIARCTCCKGLATMESTGTVISKYFHLKRDTNSAHLKFLLLKIRYSFMHSNLTFMQRSLKNTIYSEAPQLSTAKKKSFQVRTERERQVHRKEADLRRETIPGRGSCDRESTVLPSGGTGKQASITSSTMKPALTAKSIIFTLSHHLYSIARTSARRAELCLWWSI